MNQQVFKDCTFSNDIAEARAKESREELMDRMFGMGKLWGDKDRIRKLLELADGIPTKDIVILSRERYDELESKAEWKPESPVEIVERPPLGM